MQNLPETLKEKDRLNDLDEDGKIILRDEYGCEVSVFCLSGTVLTFDRCY
jgi:hypothetical protein